MEKLDFVQKVSVMSLATRIVESSNEDPSASNVIYTYKELIKAIEEKGGRSTDAE